MDNPQLVMYEEEFSRVQVVTDRLVREAYAQSAFVVDKAGQLISGSGEIADLDTTSLASLAAGNVAATTAIAHVLSENEFATQFHEGEKQNVHIQVVAARIILVVIFDQRTSLGLVRLRAKRASMELETIFSQIGKRADDPFAPSPFSEITEDDIDSLFKD